ncbi:Mobile element protein (plasmid) [Candidatus Enterovibrio altilux]|uniref:Mobile element protein n=1 Tax=Candidatus Enterovibrio altilux TaxID=1927128 RepID=A0A291BAS4_9GAMM|nr:Mobile element protein [Candidatus Enterovibrio luxaltus]
MRILMSLRGLQVCINSIFKFIQLSLPCSHYSCISKRTKTINVTFKTKNKGSIQHLAINSIGG